MGLKLIHLIYYGSTKDYVYKMQGMWKKVYYIWDS